MNFLSMKSYRRNKKLLHLAYPAQGTENVRFLFTVVLNYLPWSFNYSHYNCLRCYCETAYNLLKKVSKHLRTYEFRMCRMPSTCGCKYDRKDFKLSSHIRVRRCHLNLPTVKIDFSIRYDCLFMEQSIIQW